MTAEEYKAGLAYASIFPFYGTLPHTEAKDIYTNKQSLLLKLNHIYDRQYTKNSALRYTILYLTFADDSFVEEAKDMYIRISDSEILMFENTVRHRYTLYIDATLLELHARTLKFTTDRVYFQEHGHADIVTARTYKMSRIFPTLAILAACVWKWT